MFVELGACLTFDCRHFSDSNTRCTDARFHIWTLAELRPHEMHTTNFTFYLIARNWKVCKAGGYPPLYGIINRSFNDKIEMKRKAIWTSRKNVFQCQSWSQKKELCNKKETKFEQLKLTLAVFGHEYATELLKTEYLCRSYTIVESNVRSNYGFRCANNAIG